MTTVCAMLLSICADVDVNWSKAALYFADVMIILFLSVQCNTLHGTVKQNIKSPLFPIFSWAFVSVDPMNVPTKFEVRSFTRC